MLHISRISINILYLYILIYLYLSRAIFKQFTQRFSLIHLDDISEMFSLLTAKKWLITAEIEPNLSGIMIIECHVIKPSNTPEILRSVYKISPHRENTIDFFSENPPHSVPPFWNVDLSRRLQQGSSPFSNSQRYLFSSPPTPPVLIEKLRLNFRARQSPPRQLWVAPAHRPSVPRPSRRFLRQKWAIILSIPLIQPWLGKHSRSEWKKYKSVIILCCLSFLLLPRNSLWRILREIWPREGNWDRLNGIRLVSMLPKSLSNCYFVEIMDRLERPWLYVKFGSSANVNPTFQCYPCCIHFSL